MSITARFRQALTQLEELAITADKTLPNAPRFAQTLFKCYSPRLTDCVKELAVNLDQLDHAKTAAQVAFLADIVTAQFTALQREISTQTLRQQERVHTKPAHNRKNYAEVYDEFTKHQEYERRLTEMIRIKESNLNRCETLAQQRTLQQEIAAYEGRLQRCKSALQKIERRIEQQDSRLPR
ncbi:MAG: primosomal replication protein PriC [Plesiomonas sp.]|uniref:primosomal replication protein PriC n=1 Tax=Plesiomonas sp. TaxID=2486279 RepID=UPI003F367AE8